MKTTIYCTNPTRGLLAFYLVQNQKEYFLFYQPYRSNVARYFTQGQTLNNSLDFSKGKGDTCLLKTMSKLPMYIRYVEKDSGLVVLEQTRRALDKQKRTTAGRRDAESA